MSKHRQHPDDSAYDITAQEALTDDDTFARLTLTQTDRNTYRLWLVGHQSRVISQLHVRKHAHLTAVALGTATDQDVADYHFWRGKAHGFKSLLGKGMTRLGCNNMGYPLPHGDDEVDPADLGRHRDTLHTALIVLAGAVQRLIDAEASDDGHEFDNAHDYLRWCMARVNVDEPGGRKSLAALLAGEHTPNMPEAVPA